jgi:hypothetical protein
MPTPARPTGTNRPAGTWHDIPPSYAAALTAKYNAWLNQRLPAESLAPLRAEAGVGAGEPVPRLRRFLIAHPGHRSPGLLRQHGRRQAFPGSVETEGRGGIGPHRNPRWSLAESGPPGRASKNRRVPPFGGSFRSGNPGSPPWSLVQRPGMEETREGSDAAIVALEGIHWAA